MRKVPPPTRPSPPSTIPDPSPGSAILPREKLSSGRRHPATVSTRDVDPHDLYAYPDPVFFLNADPDSDLTIFG